MIPVLLAQLGLPLLVKAVAAGLGRIDHPMATEAARALGAVEGAVTAGGIPGTAVAEANRHLERMAELDSADMRAALEEVNRSLRAEVASEDAFVRRMRPTFGYVLAATWAAQMLAVAWTVIADPGRAGSVIEAIASLGTIWTVGLGVLGIYVFKRSEEKRAAAGEPPPESALGTLLHRIAPAARR